MELKIQNISKEIYNGTKIVDNISLTISKGVFGLVGPQNSGKSSLVRILASLDTPDSGTITIDNNILPNKQINIGYLPQYFDFYPKTNVVGFLNHIAILKGINNKKVREDFVDFLIRKTGITTDLPINKCTLNTKKRLGIAQALLGSPELVILDDPLGGIKTSDREPIYELINDFGSTSIVFLVTNNIEDINSLCNNLAIIKSGKILFEGNAKEALNKLQGNIYEAVLKKTGEVEEDFLRNGFHVISQKRKLGQPVFHIYSETNLPQFNLVKAELEDLYNKIITSSSPIYV